MAKKIDLQAIVSKYYASLYRFGLALAKNESEAADLMQETFLILAKHEKRIREPEKIKAWLFTTLRREFLRKIRIHTAHPEVEFQPEEYEIPEIESDALRTIDGRTYRAYPPRPISLVSSLARVSSLMDRLSTVRSPKQEAQKKRTDLLAHTVNRLNEASPWQRFCR